MSTEAVPRCSIVDLPDSALQRVFSSLELRDLVRCEAVCRRWLRLVRDPVPWSHVQVVYEVGLVKVISRGNYYNDYDYGHFLPLYGKLIRTLRIVETCHRLNRKYLTSTCTNLHSLQIYTRHLNKQLVKYITSHKNLTELSMSCHMAGSEFDYRKVHPIVAFQDLPRLHTLKLHGRELLRQENRENILRCRLKNIDITHSDFADAEYMERLITSQKLTLTRFRTSYGKCISTRCLQQLALCPRLKEFFVGKLRARLRRLVQTIFPDFHFEVVPHTASRYGRWPVYCTVKATRT